MVLELADVMAERLVSELAERTEFLSVVAKDVQLVDKWAVD